MSTKLKAVDLSGLRSALDSQSLPLAPLTCDRLFRVAAALDGTEGLTRQAIADKLGLRPRQLTHAMQMGVSVGLLEMRRDRKGIRGQHPATWVVRPDWQARLTVAAAPQIRLPKHRLQLLAKADWESAGYQVFQGWRAATVVASIGDSREVTIETLANEVGVSRNTMKEYLKTLDDLGIVTRQRLGMGPYKFVTRWEAVEALGIPKNAAKRVSLAAKKEYVRIAKRPRPSADKLDRQQRHALAVADWEKLGFGSLDQWELAKRITGGIGAEREASCRTLGQELDLPARVVERGIRVCCSLGIIRAERGGRRGRQPPRKLTVDWNRIENSAMIKLAVVRRSKPSTNGQATPAKHKVGRPEKWGQFKAFVLSELALDPSLQSGDLRERFRAGATGPTPPKGAARAMVSRLKRPK